MFDFPKDFLWGAATSSYQVEGDNSNSDWWEWEKRVGLKDVSGQACRHYQLYREDFDLAKTLFHNAHRLSIEWSRIEPSDNTFSEEQLGHYIEVIAALRERGIEPIVTLHHFTNPVWFTKIGGWQNPKSPEYFLRYVERVIGALGSQVRYWVTINEPMVYVYHSYILGDWPPQEKSFIKAKAVRDNLARAHVQAYRFIHNYYKNKGLNTPLVSIAQNIQAFIACKQNLKNKLAIFLRDKLYNFGFIDVLARQRSLDFIGVNYYTRGLIDIDKWSFAGLLLDHCCKNHNALKKNTLGWEIYPEGLYDLLLKLKKYGLPVLILENGISTEDDSLRWEFISGHLEAIYRARQKGCKVSGYIYWSLLDNFEWDKGFGHHFGLIGVDYTNYKRTVRESAKKLAEVCKTGRLD